MYSIGKLCDEFKLSRSTLLYYDKIGLLHAFKRTSGNYRQYSEDDRNRLNQICMFREAGVPLNQIKSILDKDSMKHEILGKRLDEINQEVRYLRLQQKFIVEMLKMNYPADKRILLDTKTFVSILKSAGLDEETMDLLHIQFEKNSPESHQMFLEFLGVPDEEITQIRAASRE